MPEIYRDLLSCVVCDKAGGGKIKKCANCFSVSYCGRECQAVDWPRHKRLCDPVMVKDLGEKGKGLVASKDFEIGDLIMKDRAVVESTADISMDIRNLEQYGVKILQQLWQQPVETIRSFFELKANNVVLNKFANNSELPKQAVAIFLNNRIGDRVYLKLSRINHSCDPNAAWQNIDESFEEEELRAVSNIMAGDEILCNYLSSQYLPHM